MEFRNLFTIFRKPNAEDSLSRVLFIISQWVFGELQKAAVSPSEIIRELGVLYLTIGWGTFTRRSKFV